MRKRWRYQARLWLAPRQVVIIPIKDDHEDYAAKIKDDLQSQGIRVIIDQRNESLGKRIRERTIQKVPYLLIVGDKEVKEKKVSVRKYGEGNLGAIAVDEFIKRIQEDIITKK